MESQLLFFDRRKSSDRLQIENRRNGERRKLFQAYSPERRRLASQVRRYEREAFKIPVHLELGDTRESTSYTRDIGTDRKLFILGEHPVIEKASPPTSTLPMMDQPLHNKEEMRMVQQVTPEEKCFPLTKRRKRKHTLEFTPNPDWVIEMDGYLEPYRRAILQSRLVQGMSDGKLSIRQIRGWNIQFYPFIESFPHFMGLNLARATDRMSRTYLIDNIRVEKRHADQWIDMAYGFGVTPEEISHSPILAEVEALTHWLWSINSRGSFSEALAATNYAIEGVTQGIATIMVRGFSKYEGLEGVHLDRKAYQWMEAHISYDDLHPFQALEIIKQQVMSPEAQKKIKQAARRSLEYLYMALDTCYTTFA